MKKIISAVLLSTIFLSGCNMAVHVPVSSIKPIKQVTPLSEVDVAIIIPKKIESKAYQFDAAPIYLYPGFVDSLVSSLNVKFKKVYIFKEQQFKPDEYPGNLVIIPNWEIERNNLNTELIVKNVKSGAFIIIDESVLIEKRSELRSFFYVTSVFTIIGIPISMSIDKKDITHRVEVAMDKSISNLADKLHTVLIKEMGKKEGRSAVVPGSI